MLEDQKAKKIYRQIQQKLFYMIPEKWDRLYLYASVMEQFNKLETGEMFFYYFPKGILKKKPVNVYEIPSKFNIDEKIYYDLTDKLYELIKELRELFIELDQEPWSNITISIENFKFIIEYGYENLKHSQYSSYEKHIIWRHMYLKTDLNTYTKKERNIVLEYLKNVKFFKEKKEVYTEGLYKGLTHNMIEYDKTENIKEKELLNEIEDIKLKEILNQDDKKEKNRNQILEMKK